IKALINWMGLKRGQKLLDPFAGSGTALIESKLIGIDSIGIDIDPFCILMSKVKLDLLDLAPSSLTQIPLKTAFEHFKTYKGKSHQVGLSRFVEADPDSK